MKLRTKRARPCELCMHYWLDLIMPIMHMGILVKFLSLCYKKNEEDPYIGELDNRVVLPQELGEKLTLKRYIPCHLPF